MLPDLECFSGRLFHIGDEFRKCPCTHPSTRIEEREKIHVEHHPKEELRMKFNTSFLLFKPTILPYSSFYSLLSQFIHCVVNKKWQLFQKKCAKTKICLRRDVIISSLNHLCCIMALIERSCDWLEFPSDNSCQHLNCYTATYPQLNVSVHHPCGLSTYSMRRTWDNKIIYKLR